MTVESTLDPVRRLHVLAAALPGVTIVEDVLDAPFDDVWAIAGDLEVGVPQFEDEIARVQIVRRDGDRLAIVAHQRRGRPISFDVLLRPGLCWMQSRHFLVGMAATPEGARARFAHAEGTRARFGVLARPLIARKIRKEMRAIERLARARRG